MFKKRRATQVKITFEAWIIYKKGKRLWRRLICRRWFKAWAALPRCSKVGFRQYEGVRHFVRLLERWHERYQRRIDLEGRMDDNNSRSFAMPGGYIVRLVPKK